MPQYGFFFDQSRCIDCRACSVACRDWNNIPPGPVKWLRMFSWEKGSFPNTKLNLLFAPCYHCENPVCVDAAEGAVYKEEKYGAVLIDTDMAASPKMRAAWEACPYGAIIFESDAPNAKASKCTMCVDRLEQGRLPICVEACPMRALDFGVLSEMQKKHGASRQLEDMPSGDLTKPAIIFKPSSPKSKLVPYDETKALRLLGQRPGGLPPVYASTDDVTKVLPKTVGRSQLILKAGSTRELIEATQNDES